MVTHPDGSVTLTREEFRAMVLIAQVFQKILPQLENIVNDMDEFEKIAEKIDNPLLFLRELIH